MKEDVYQRVIYNREDSKQFFIRKKRIMYDITI